MTDDKYWRDFEEFKKLLASYLKDVQRLRRRNEIMNSAIISAYVTMLTLILVTFLQGR